MQRVIWATVLAFAIAMVLGPVVIPWLKKMKFGQTIYELGLESHKVKQGTPTMGGIIFAVPMIIVPILFSTADQRWSFLPMALVSTLGFGLVGFVDDYIKVSKKRSLGLTPMQKIVPQVVISLVLAIWAYCTPQIGSALIVPFTDKTWDLGLFYIPVMMFVLVGTVNSANLLDGVDGLLSGCSLIDFATMALVCVALGAANPENAGNMTNMMVFCGAAAGAGVSLALGGDFMICADNAKFILAFVNLGLVPDTGATYLLSKSIGTARTMELAATGRPMSAEEAKALGLAYKVTTVEELDEVTLAFARKLAAGPLISYKNIKKQLYDANYADYKKWLSETEVPTQHECSASMDFQEGCKAFMEKRKATFEGR